MCSEPLACLIFPLSCTTSVPIFHQILHFFGAKMPPKFAPDLVQKHVKISTFLHQAGANMQGIFLKMRGFFS